MTPTEDDLALAANVLRLIAMRDSRFQNTTPAQRTALVHDWARAMMGKVWPQESEDAVSHYYSSAEGKWKITPTAIIQYCQGLPPWSSAEHAKAFVLEWINYPYSGNIERFSGMEGPRPTPVDPWKQWAYNNIDGIVSGILERRVKVPGKDWGA